MSPKWYQYKNKDANPIYFSRCLALSFSKNHSSALSSFENDVIHLTTSNITDIRRYSEYEKNLDFGSCDMPSINLFMFFLSSGILP